MLPVYEETGSGIMVYSQKSRHASPHLHQSIEFVYILEGELALGVGENLFPMKEGDLAVVFPELVHHCQVFSPGKNTACHIFASRDLAPGFMTGFAGKCPEDPVVPEEKVHPDIRYTIDALRKEFEKKRGRKRGPSGKENGKGKAAGTEGTAFGHPPFRSDGELVHSEREALAMAYVNILLARSIPCFHWIEKSAAEGQDLIYQVVSYISAHFMEEVTLNSMAHDLGMSPYTLSRVFSGTFHRNFNRYLNETRLDYACTLLRHTDRSVTDICFDAGFESQRTFNRCFSELLHQTPREYRKSFGEAGGSD